MSKSKKATRVGFFLYDPNENLVLIHKRDDKPNIDSPKKWDYFGGLLETVDLGDPDHALKRELYEELGVSVEQEYIKVLAENDDEKMYFIVYPKYKTSAFKFDEGAGFAWLSFEEALGLFNEDETKSLITPRANDYLKTMKGKLK